MSIEALEPRITPAIVFTYTEFDGDFVTVRISKGAPADATFTNTPVPGYFGSQLTEIHLNENQIFKGASITISAKPQDLTGDGVIRGDGLANVGLINAGGIDLRMVKVEGDLGGIVAGDSTLTSPGLKTLSTISFGLFGAPNGELLDSVVTGRLGSFLVKTDVKNARVSAGSIGSMSAGGSIQGVIFDIGGAVGSVKVDGSVIAVTLIAQGDIGFVRIKGDLYGGGGEFGDLISAGKIAGVTIGGSFIGGFGKGVISSGSDMGPIKIRQDLVGNGDDEADLIATGRIISAGKLASVTVGGSIVGSSYGGGSIYSGGSMGLVRVAGDVVGDGPESGFIHAAGPMKGVRIEGSLLGGRGTNSGKLTTLETMGSVEIDGDVRGDGELTGLIEGKNIRSVTIGGSLIGGNRSSSGAIYSPGTIELIRIEGDIVGGNAVSSATESTGYLQGDRISKVLVGGSMYSGFDGSAPGATLTNSGSIGAVNDIGSITIQGGLFGNAGGKKSYVQIFAGGQSDSSPNGKSDVAIGRITIGGNTKLVRILAGYNVDLVGVNADAQIGAIVIGGNVESTNIIAGVHDGGDGFGDFNDAKITGPGVKDNADASGAVSRIASIVIKGYALGNLTPNGTVFGIEAQHLVSVKVGGAVIPLKFGALNDRYFDAFPLGPTRINSGDGFDFHAFEVYSREP